MNEKSRAGPRMQWLRMRPPEYTVDDDDDYEEEEEQEAQMEEISAGKVNATRDGKHKMPSCPSL